MRNFIRHPTDIPIELIPEKNSLAIAESYDDKLKIEKMENVSFGGLMFQSAIPYTQNKVLIVKIKSVSPTFKGRAHVSWCQKSGRFYTIGLEFMDKESEFQIRMVEQVCHIMQYRKEVLEKEGREMDENEAAEEWIAHHAENFPS